MNCKTKTRALSLLLAVCVALSLCAAPLAAQNTAEQTERTQRALYTANPAPSVGSIGGEWAVIALARSGYAAPQSYWDDYYSRVKQEVLACRGVLHARKYTEYSRVVLALTAIGADPSDVGGYNLLTPLGDYDKTVWQGINGAIWALLALDSGDYAMPQNSAAKTQATREKYVNAILAAQCGDGGWRMGSSGASDADLTAMALQALAPYRTQTEVAAAVERGLHCLSALQSADGGFASGGVSNAESAAQVVIALCTLQIDLRAEEFVKGGSSALDALLRFAAADGGFRHSAEDSGSNAMATEQALLALAAVARANTGGSGLYEMNDAALHVTTGAPGLSGKHADVRACPVIAPGTTFADIADHPDRVAIEGLSARRIINGKSGGVFDPDVTMTRAEFCAIVVRALGLHTQTTDAFSDVRGTDWFAPYVGAAYRYGLVQGVGGGRFAPNGTITRQEAAVMVARAASLCGMNTARSDAQAGAVLIAYTDGDGVAAWAKSAAAFCCDAALWDSTDGAMAPRRNILRCEVAQMLYRMLSGARLL